MIEVVQRVSVQGTKPYYEDAVDTDGDFAWVIDGATSLVGDTGDDGGAVARFVRSLSDALRAGAVSRTSVGIEADLADMVRAAVVHATSVLGPLPVGELWESPSAAFALAYVSAHRVRVVQAGDVAWKVLDEHGAVVAGATSEPRFATAAARTRDQIAQLEPDGGFETARRAVYRRTRAAMNTTGGYPIAQYGIRWELDVDEHVVDVENAIVELSSDGWPRMVDGGFDRRVRGAGAGAGAGAGGLRRCDDDPGPRRVTGPGPSNRARAG